MIEITLTISPGGQADMTPGLLNYKIVTLAALFPIVNPIGAGPVFCSLTATDTRLERKKAAQQIVMNVVVILAAFLLGGRVVLVFFGISLNVLRIADGLLVANAAWEMVTSRQRLTLLSMLGRNGLGALNRILGFFILAIAVQLIADGLISLMQAAMPKLFN
jgi:small neutral amino acid transporter SnatA (MarC family)